MRLWEERRHPGDVRRGLGPLEGSADEVTKATPVRWRVVDQIDRLLGLCRAVRRQDGRDRGLSLEDALVGGWELERLRDWAACRSAASWWVARAGTPTQAILEQVRVRSGEAAPRPEANRGR